MDGKLWTLARALLQRRRVARELNDELEFHIEIETRARIQAGMSPSEARRTALRDVRTLWLESLWKDVRLALRIIRRNPGFAAVALLSLAVGIGFNTASFTIVDALLFRPIPVQGLNRLVDVFTALDDTTPYGTLSYPDFIDLKIQNDVFDDMLGYSPSIDAVTLSDRTRLAMGETVTGDYFPLLGVKPAVGRLLLPEDDRPGAPRAAVISSALWNREFGRSASVVGQSIRIKGLPYTVVGVAPATFTGMLPLLAPELWTPAVYVEDVEAGGITSYVPSPTGNTRLERRGDRWMFVKGRLKAGVTVEHAATNLRLIGERLQTMYVQTNKDRYVTIIPTRDVHIHPVADRALLPIALGLMLVVALVLLVACANVASMLLARASSRQKEIGIRLAIGASRRRILQQLLTESAMLSLLGAAGGILLASSLTRFAMSVRLPVAIPLSFALRIDTRILAFTAAVTIVAALVAGLVPALKATRPDLVRELKGDVAGAQGIGRRWTLRDALVAVQIAVATVLLVTASLLARSLIAAQRVNLGFRSDGLAIVSTETSVIGYDEARARAFYDRALERIGRLPGVVSVALAARLPFAINYSRSSIFLPDRQGPTDKPVAIDVARVSADYFNTIGVPIEQGRNFNSSDIPTSRCIVIVNDAMARKYWPSETPVGKRLHEGTYDGRECEVVGVSADYKVNTIGEALTPYIHFATSQRINTGEAIIARTRGDAAALVVAMRREMLALEPNVVFLDQQTMDRQVAATLFPQRAGAISVSAVGTVAILLAAIGLYGLIAYTVARRAREIGIRIALGASVGAVVRMVVRQGLWIVTTGIAAGALLAFGAARIVTSVLYGVSALDPIAWAGSIAILFAAAILAHLVPARRAAAVDPSIALRSE